jgi:3-oxoacyl-[acyl-carrier protein] reductase
MINPLQFSGKTVMVTGASSGIGRSTSILFSSLGARVVLVGRNEDKLSETAALMEGDHHRIAPFDLTHLDQIPRWMSELVEELGPFSGLAHCAGITSLVPLRVLSLDHLESVMRTNFYSAVALTKEFARKRIHQAPGSIVLVASVAGQLGVAARAAYSASKGALIAFAKSAAIELAKSGVRVNCVAPAYVGTDMYEKSSNALSSEHLKSLVEVTQPLGLGSPLDVAHAIAFLMAETGRWITGSVLAVDGGYSAQ